MDQAQGSHATKAIDTFRKKNVRYILSILGWIVIYLLVIYSVASLRILFVICVLRPSRVDQHRHKKLKDTVLKFARSSFVFVSLITYLLHINFHGTFENVALYI